MSTIEPLLAEVAEAGAVLGVEHGKLVTRGATLPRELVARLLAAKPEVVPVLRQQDQQRRQAAAPAPPAPPVPDPSRCRHCREPIPWHALGALVFADGAAAHLTCYERAEIERLLDAARRAVGEAIGTTGKGEILTRAEARP
jgi:hypothetical protein